MTLESRETQIKAVVICTEGSATFHIKTLREPYTCYKASLRGKFRKKTKDRMLKLGDQVLIKVLENQNKSALIFEKLKAEAETEEVPFKLDLDGTHDCTFEQV